MGLYEIIHGIKRPIKEERATWVIGYERDNKELSWSTSANSSGEAQRAFRDYMEGQGLSSSDYRITGTFQSTTNDMDDVKEDDIRGRDFSELDDDDDFDSESDDYFPPEPQDDDFIIADNPSGGYELGSNDNGYLGSFDDIDGALKKFKAWVKRNNWHPNLWFQSDHGNVWLIDDEGNEIRNENVNEENTTSNLDGGEGQPQVPGAFQRKRPSAADKKKERDNATSSTGWGIKPKTSNYIQRRNEILSRAESLIDSINEARYADYATDETMSPKEKINSSISQVNRKLYEIERMINHAVRLRTESGIEDVFWKSTKNQFVKISERMMRINSKLREFNK